MEKDRSPATVPLAEQVAIVIGARGSIGREICLALLRAGAQVVAADVDADGREASSQRRQGSFPDQRVVSTTVDIRREEEIEALVSQTLDRFGRVDILVHATGVVAAAGSGQRMITDLSATEFDLVIERNLTSAFLCNRAVLPPMIRQRSGQIVNLASTLGQRGQALDAAYCASQAGIISLTQSLDEEVRRFGIRAQMVLCDLAGMPQPDPSSADRAQGVLPQRVAEAVLHLLCLPKDMLLGEITVSLFQARRGGRSKSTSRDVGPPGLGQ